MPKTKLLLFAFIVVLVSSFFYFDLDTYLNLEYFKSQQLKIDNFYRTEPLQTALIFFAIYIAVTALSLPGAALMTLAGGAIFGLLVGR